MSFKNFVCEILGLPSVEDYDSLYEENVILKNQVEHYKRWWLFTGDKYNDIRDVVWLYYDIVKCGPYLQHRRLPEGVFPASDNQELVFNRFCPRLSPDKRLERLDKLDRIYKEIEFRGAKFWRNGSHGT